MKFADVAGIRLTEEKSTGRRGRSNTTHFLNFDRKNRTSAKISLAADVVEEALPVIVEHAQAHGLTLTDQR